MATKNHKGVTINTPKDPVNSTTGFREQMVIEKVIDTVCESVRDVEAGSDISVALDLTQANINNKRKAVISLSSDYKKSVEEKIQTKQDKLTAGDNITIINNVISAKGGIVSEADGVKTKVFLIKNWMSANSNTKQENPTSDCPDFSVSPHTVIPFRFMNEAGIHPLDIVGFQVMVRVIGAAQHISESAWGGDLINTPDLRSDTRWFNVAISPNNPNYLYENDPIVHYRYGSGATHRIEGILDSSGYGRDTESLYNADNIMMNNFIAWLDLQHGGSGHYAQSDAWLNKPSIPDLEIAADVENIRGCGIMLRCWRPCALDIKVVINYLNDSRIFFEE